MRDARSTLVTLLAAAATVGAGATAKAQEFSWSPHRPGPPERLQSVLDRFVAEHPLSPGVSLHVEAPRIGLPFSGAAGRFAHGLSRPLRADDPYRLASVTKTWTAATVLRLVEDGRLSLGDTLDELLPLDLVDRLHVDEQGVSRGRSITLHQLLNHTSGIHNFSTDERWIALLQVDPRREWTAESLVEWAIDNGRPTFPPGKGWSYNDTGYALLTMVLKRLTGRPHPQVSRDLLPMGRFPDTYVEELENPPPGARDMAHQYAIVRDVDDYDPSYDTWGGGGIVSTGRDQAQFMRLLFAGGIFRESRTLRTMKGTVAGRETLPGQGPVAVEYGLGIQRLERVGVTCWHHTGAWGAFMYACPALDLTFAGSTMQFQDQIPNSRALATEVVRIVARALPETIEVVAAPWRVTAGHRAVLRIRAWAGAVPLHGARVTLGGRSTVTDAGGEARLTRRFPRRGTQQLSACREDLGCARTTIRVR